MSFSGFSQEKFKATVSMGEVFPLNNFKNTDLNSSVSGYAQNGFTLNVDGDYFIINRLAVTLRFHFGNAPINKDAFKNFLVNDLQGYYPPADTAQFEMNAWQWVTPLIGLKYNYPIVINKVYIEAGAFTGLCFIQIPNQNLIYNDKVNNRLVVSHNIETNCISMPLALNAGIRFKINPTVQLKIAAEYFSARSQYTHESYYQWQNSVEQIEISKTEFNVPIQTVNVTAGLVYSF